MARTRRTFSAEFKAKVVLEVLSGRKSAAEAGREYNLKADLLSHWKRQFVENAARVFETSAEVDPQQVRMAELERLAGKQSLEIEILKKALTLLPQVRKQNER
jgi:transposase-like protein